MLAQSRPLLGRFAICSVLMKVDASAELRSEGAVEALTFISSLNVPTASPMHRSGRPSSAS